MSKKIFVLLVLMLLTLSGCNTSKVKDNEAFTFSMLYNETTENPYNKDWEILKEYKDKFNVTIDPVLGDNSDFETAVELNLTSENPPDVILKCWPDTIEEYANDGLLVSIDEYAYLMPHYTAYIEKNDLQSEVDELKLTNGKYYILPGYQRETQIQQWIYRYDIFEENNIETPTTYDELYDALVTLKAKYPDTTPITASWGGAHLLSMMGAGYGIPAGWSGTRYYNENIKEWEYAPATDNYKELYKFLNKSYSAGILDPDFFDQSNDEFIEKIVDGNALVTVSWIASGFNNWNEQLVENGITNGEWKALPVMESTNGISALPAVSTFKKGIAISTNSEGKPYFEDMIKFLDWAIYSDEGIDLSYWGVEDLTYEETIDGKVFLPNIDTPKNSNGTVKTKEYGFDLLFNLNENEEFEDYKKPVEIVEFLNRSTNANEMLNITPKLILSVQETDMASIINDDLKTYMEMISKKFITGELSVDDYWNTYIARLEELGYKTLETIWNNSWEKQNE